MLPLPLTSLLSLSLVPGWEQAALNFIQHAHPASVLGNEEKRGKMGGGEEGGQATAACVIKYAIDSLFARFAQTFKASQVA